MFLLQSCYFIGTMKEHDMRAFKRLNFDLEKGSIIHEDRAYNNGCFKDLLKEHAQIELHRVNPYKIWWMGEKTFTRRGQEETFVRFMIDPDGKQVGDFTYVEKDFVTPYGNMGVVNPNNDEPTGASSFEDREFEERR